MQCSIRRFSSVFSNFFGGGMHPLPLFDQDMLDSIPATPEVASAILLLERGLDYLAQGRGAVGASLCTLARDRLRPNQADIAEMLDSFLASYAYYYQAQQAFHEASRRFVKAETEQQQLRQHVEHLLSSLREETDTPLNSGQSQSFNTSQHHQSARSSALPPAYLNGRAHIAQVDKNQHEDAENVGD